MSKVKLSVAQLTPDQANALAAKVVLATDGKSLFSTIQGLTTELHTAQYTVGVLTTTIARLRQEIAEAVAQRNELIPALEAHASGVDGVAKGEVGGHRRGL